MFKHKKLRAILGPSNSSFRFILFKIFFKLDRILKKKKLENVYFRKMNLVKFENVLAPKGRTIDQSSLNQCQGHQMGSAPTSISVLQFIRRLLYLSSFLYCERSASGMNSSLKFDLNDGRKIPVIGLGTWMAENEEQLEKAIDVAIETGYRHIDTAFAYNNEHIIGKVLKKWFSSGKLSREDIFVTTKLPPWGNNPQRVQKYFKKSLELLQLDYLDLYLVHVPFACKEKEGEYMFATNPDGTVQFEPDVNHIEVWKEMEKLVDLGLVKSIGVSNFNKAQIKRLLGNCRIKPCNLQIEHHAYLQQKDLVDFCKENKIIVTAYSPLGSPGLTQLGKEVPAILTNPVVAKIAKKHNKTTAQVLLRYINYEGIVIIPKSVHAERLKQNFDVFDFDLTEEDLKELRGLDQCLRILDFEFLFKGVKKQPEYPFTELK